MRAHSTQAVGTAEQRDLPLQRRDRGDPAPMAPQEQQEASYEHWLDRARSMMDAKAMPSGGCGNPRPPPPLPPPCIAVRAVQPAHAIWVNTKPGPLPAQRPPCTRQPPQQPTAANLDMPPHTPQHGLFPPSAPSGALGLLQEWGARLCALQRTLQPALVPARLLTFAGKLAATWVGEHASVGLACQCLLLVCCLSCR